MIIEKNIETGLTITIKQHFKNYVVQSERAVGNWYDLEAEGEKLGTFKLMAIKSNGNSSASGTVEVLFIYSDCKGSGGYYDR